MTPEDRAAYETEREADIEAKLRANREAHRRLRLQYELGDDYADATLDSYRTTDGNRKGLALARRIIDGRFIEGGAFYGEQYGNGKTALAACIAHAAISIDIPARFITMQGIMKLVQAAFKDQSAQEKVEILARIPLLVIDEIDKLYISSSGWGAHEMFEVINARSANRRPLVVTSNRESNEMNAHYSAQMRTQADRALVGATVDRLLGMTGGPRNWVHISGDSERWKH